MKQIKYYFVVFLLLICSWTKAQNSPAASGGEFLVDAPTSVSVTATLQGVGYGWNGSRVTYISSFSTTQNAWDCPKNQKNGLPYMPWGLISFTVKNNGSQIFQFYLNFRDENWATDDNNYPSHDTYFIIDPNNDVFQLKNGYNQITNLSPGNSYQIWKIWGVTPYTNDFGVPVFVENQYEGDNSNLGGTLNVASQSIPSGNWGVPPNQTTCLIGTNNERFNNIKHQNWNGNSSDYLLSRTINVPANPFNELAKFTDMNSETIEATLIDNGSNLDNIQFRDPWYVESDGTQPDIFHTFSSPYHPTGAYGQSSGGVFLDQLVSSGTYYSVKAPITKTVGGYTAIFNGWTDSPSGSVTFQNASSASTPVVFNSSGAAVTANYSRTTISESVTLPSGTYNFIGNLTVNSGAALTVNSGTTLEFPSGYGLIVNGKLIANGGTFTASSGNWNGITLNSAEGSSISNAAISYAYSPVIINSTSSVTISGCTINNSDFYGGNSSAAAAIQVWGSSPSISSTNIEGQSNSWNGVRFGSGSTGSLNNCTVENLGNGNGVIVQGGSSPTINGCTIKNNYFYGIIANTNGSGVPVIENNTLSSNGSGRYSSIVFLTSSGGVLTGNTITGSDAGVGAFSGSYPSSGGSGQGGYNLITGNYHGIVSENTGTFIYFGSYAGRNLYQATCNQIYGNTSYDAYADGGGDIIAEYD